MTGWPHRITTDGALLAQAEAALLSSRHTQLDIMAVLRAQGHNG